MRLNFLSLLAICVSLLSSRARAAERSFDFTLPAAAQTSAGIYTADGRLVRVLWTMQQLEAGHYTRAWDGKDQAGQDAPAEAYQYRVVANRSTYVNVGAIGNSGLPPDAHDHTPTGMESVAVDADGNVYTANGWDEAGADFKKWDKSGKSVYDANYQIRNGHPNGAPYAIAVDDKYLYCAVGGWAREPWNEAQQIQRFRLADGKEEKFTKTGRKDGHIQVYEWPSRKIPPGTSKTDAELMKAPLRALAIAGDTIYCADLLGGRVLKFDKATGESRGQLNVKLPNALALGPDNKILVGYEGKRIAEEMTGGALLERQDLGPVDAIEALAYDRKNDQLLIADNEIHAVRCIPLHGADRAQHLFGHAATPGDRAADAFFHLRGVAVDSQGNVITIQNEPYGGARLAKFSPDHKLLSEQFGCEFVSLGNYGIDDPDGFYSMTFHDYRLTNHDKGQWQYIGDGAPFPERRYYADVHGVPRVLKLGAHDFCFLPTGDGVQVYRIDKSKAAGRGPAFHLAAMLGGRSPTPDGQKEGKELGQWSWHDLAGEGLPRPGSFDWFKKPGQGRYSCFGMDVDPAGNIIFANTTTHSIWMIPLGPLDAKGNPTYDWKDAKEIVGRDGSALKFEPNMAQRSEDGSVYAFGWSKPWPQPKNNPFWMGGTTLARFDKTGKLLWAVPLPHLVVGLDVIPGGGCMVGEGKDARIDHYTADGLLIGAMQPGAAMHKESGWMDNHASVAVNRDPRDKKLDVFAEDDYCLRIGWYRVDDSRIQVISGTVGSRQ